MEGVHHSLVSNVLEGDGNRELCQSTCDCKDVSVLLASRSHWAHQIQRDVLKWFLGDREWLIESRCAF